MQNKIIVKSILLLPISAVILLTGCNKEKNETPSENPSIIENPSMETSSGTISEPSLTESQITESEAVTESKVYEPYQIKLYDSKGTGMPRPENYGEDMTQYYLSGELDDILSLLKDKETAEKIRTEADLLLDLATENYHLYDTAPPQENIHTYCRIYNGYLFYRVSYDNFHMKYCAVFDLRTGKRLDLSDMFFEGEEFLGVLNEKLRTAIQQKYFENYDEIEYIPIKREFSGLTENEFYFDPDTFYFPVNNPYLTKCAGFGIGIRNFDTVLNVPYDMTPLFEEDADKKISILKNEIISSENYAYSGSYVTGNINVYFFEESGLVSERIAEFLAEQTENIIDTQLDRLNEKYDWIMYTDSDESLHKSYEQDGITKTRDENYLISSGIFCNNLAYVRCENRYSQVYEKSYNLYFDLDTLEPLSSEQLFERVYGDKKINWEHTLLDLKDGNRSKWEKVIEDNPPDITNIDPENFTFKYSDGELSYYEETNDYTVFWRARAEQEKQPARSETVTEFKAYEPYQLKLYDSLGTGIPRPENYGEDPYIYTVRGNYILTLLKDRASAEKIETETQNFINYINDKYFPDEDITDETSKKKPYIEYSACNGFLFYNVEFSYNNFPMKCCLVFDIRTGERMELSDMFFDGEEFLSLLNKRLQEEIQRININSVDYYDYIPVKREFAGLTENGFYFDIYNFYFPADNPYTARYVRLNISLLNFDTVLNVPYDMSSLFEERTDKTVSFSRWKNSITSDSYAYSKHYLTGNIMVHLLEESSYLSKEQTEFLNNAAVSLTKGEAFENIKQEYGWNIYTDDDEIWYYSYAPDELPEVTYTDHYEIKIQAVKNKFANVSIYNSGVNEAYLGYNLYFDLGTLEPLDTKQFFEYVYGSSNVIWDYVYIYSNETDIDGFIKDEAPDISKLETKYLRYVSLSSGLFYEGIYDGHYISGRIKLAEE